MNPSYDVEFLPATAKEFRQLQTDVKWRIRRAVDALGAEPRPRDCIKLKGTDNWYRIRIGAYRVVYLIDERAKQVTVTCIKHRKESYR